MRQPSNGPVHDPDWCELITNHPSGGCVSVATWKKPPQWVLDRVNRDDEVSADQCRAYRAEWEQRYHLLYERPWFIERMLDDVWFFALLLNTGHHVIIECIEKITRDPATGTIWLDVRLHVYDDTQHGEKFCPGPRIGAVHEDRSSCSIRLDSVVAAYEVAST